MNEFSQISNLYEELLAKVILQEIQLESMRKQITALSETIQDLAPQQGNQEAA
ncbi:hypothetical protein [Microbulbifer epialgicus]|uniref:Uncharacterized protein n=1 Tax=Microbulbifer epialgicus TaxID=393907 RepID=A0ABV4P550_9GAMM